MTWSISACGTKESVLEAVKAHSLAGNDSVQAERARAYILHELACQPGTHAEVSAYGHVAGGDGSDAVDPGRYSSANICVKVHTPKPPDPEPSPPAPASPSPSSASGGSAA